MQNTFKHWCLAGLVLTFLFYGFNAIAASDFDALKQSVVRIVTETDQGRGHGTGFVINDQGYIATNVHVIAGGNQIKAIPPNSNTLYDVNVIAWSEQLDLAVLQVRSINLRPMKLSLASLQVAQTILAIGYPGGADRRNRLAREPSVQKGAISRIFSGAWHTQQFRIIQHSAETNPGNSGGPLVDECGRVIGVNTQASLVVVDSPSDGITRVPHAAGIYWSSHIEELVKLLKENNISFQSEDEPCLPSDGAGRAEEALQEAEQAGSKAEQALSKVEDLLEQFLIWVILLGSLTLAALLLGLRKPRQQIIRVAEQMSRPLRRRESDGAVQQPVKKQPSENQRPTHGLLLAGFDGNGNCVHIALSPEKFAGQRLGVSLGRHPDLVDEIIQHENVSRRHVRITVRDGQFYIEDLNSSNGTFLNRHRLPPFSPAQLDYGATVALGGLEVMVSKF